MYLHLTGDTTGQHPHVDLDFRDDQFGLDTRIGLSSDCGDPECQGIHEETIVLSLRHVALDDMDTPSDIRDEYVPTVRLMLAPDDAAAAVAVWVRMLSEEHPELLARAMDRVAASETIIRRD